ncbi:FAD-dependent oxidoreductase [bacterium]|nr:FAD-dependent oxidoreductase [bacterium]
MLGSGAALVLASCSFDAADSDRPAPTTGSGLPAPTDALLTHWSQDPYALGSYSYLAAGATPRDRTRLKAPIDQTVFFAGEATSRDYPATAHGAILSGIAAADSVRSSLDSGTVLVIGAGLAGLAAASALTAAGYETAVLEARSRVGGRVHSAQLAGSVIDLGASWIHGRRGNPLSALADTVEAARVPTDYDSISIYGPDGSPLDRASLRALEDLAEEVEDDLSDAGGDTGPMADRLIDLGYEPSDPLHRYLAGSTLEHEFAADVTDLAAAAFYEGEEFSGRDELFPDGMAAITGHLASGLDIRVGQVVEAVTYQPRDVRLTLTGGAEERGSAAIVTLPLGVLKSDAVRWNPVLPAEKLGAISRLGMGTLSKAVLAFDEVFWDEDVDLIGYAGPTSGEWAEWLNLAPVVGAPVLVGFNAGSVGRRMEATPDEAVVASAMATLSTIYG